jgi:hypothetical protein
LSEAADSVGRDALELIVASVAAWRVTHLLAYEDGPADVVARIRSHLGDGVLGQLADCFDCMSVWVAAVGVLALGGKRQRILRWLAISGTAMLLERVTASMRAATIEPGDQGPKE